MSEELNLVDYLSLARNFAWLVHQSICNSKSGLGPLTLTQRRMASEIGEIVQAIDDARRQLQQKVSEGKLPALPQSVGLPPNAALKRLAETILRCKGQGSVTIGSSTFTCEAAK